MVPTVINFWHFHQVQRMLLLQFWRCVTCRLLILSFLRMPMETMHDDWPVPGVRQGVSMPPLLFWHLFDTQLHIHTGILSLSSSPWKLSIMVACVSPWSPLCQARSDNQRWVVATPTTRGHVCRPSAWGDEFLVHLFSMDHNFPTKSA